MALAHRGDMAEAVGTHRARFWHDLEDGRLQCDLCPRLCKLHEGQHAFCFVRARKGEWTVLTTYGRSSSFCVDSVEKKALNHFLPGPPAACGSDCRPEY